MDPASRNSGQRNSHFFIELAVSPRLESVECPTNIKLQPFIPSFSPTQNIMPTVWRKDSKEVISNKIVMKPSHCMRWFLKNYASTDLTKWHELSPPVWECGKYRQISAINPCLFSPRERERRGMHPLIYASVEITEKAREECRILLDVSSSPLAPSAGVSS